MYNAFKTWFEIPLYDQNGWENAFQVTIRALPAYWPRKAEQT